MSLPNESIGLSVIRHAQIQRGDRGSGPLKNYKNVGLPSNMGTDSLANHKATKPAFNVGQSTERMRNGVSQAGQ